MTIKQLIGRWAFAITLVSIVPVYSTAQTLDQAISELNSAIADAESKNRSLSDILADLIALIQRLTAEISTVNSKKTSVKADIEVIKKQIITVENESSAYAEEELGHKETTVQQEIRIDDEKEKIAQLHVDISEAEADLAIEQEKLTALTDLYDKVSALQFELASSSTTINNLRQTYSDALDAHTQWLSDFNNHVIGSKPDFNSISGANTFETAIFQISDFQNSVPNMERVRSKERIFKSQAVNSMATMVDISIRIGELFETKGAGYLKSINSTEMSNIKKTLHIEVNEIALLVNFLENSIDEHAYSRNRAIDHTTVSWTRLSEQYLMTANATYAGSIINDVEIALNDNKTYGIIRSSVGAKIMEYKKLQRNLSSPRLARRKAMVVKGLIGTYLEGLQNLNVSYSTRTEIEAMLFDYQNDVTADLNYIANDIASEQAALSKRTYMVGNYLSRYSDRFNQTCLDIGQELLDQPEATVAHEQSYVDFRVGCFR